MNVSVIIPSFNEEAVIADCLASLSKQSYSSFEVIVVDDGSTDNTREIIKKARLPHLTLLTQDHKGPGEARNLGAQKAKGKILVFVDSDMTFDKDFIRHLVTPIEKGETKGTFSKEEYVSNWDNPLARSWTLNEGWEEGKRHPVNYPDTQKVFRALLKSEFARVGGFERGGHYTDDYLSDKLGYEATAAENAKFFHKNPDNKYEVFNQARWVAKRKYKLGFIGYIIAFARSFVRMMNPYNLVIALYHREKTYIEFKFVYELGIMIGIIEYILGKQGK